VEGQRAAGRARLRLGHGYLAPSTVKPFYNLYHPVYFRSDSLL
jgi:hypothetical protein